jgi:integrase
VTRGEETEKVWFAKRWIPWVLAYTGARIGEIAQLRKRDLHKVDDHWEIEITPEAGTVKSGSFRRVPLHHHLVELGFPDAVLAAPDGHLFLEPNTDTGDVLGPLQGVKNRVAEFVRLHVPDKGVAPNHGWRHLFVHTARGVGMDVELRGMILGQAGQTVAAREYGGPAGLYREVNKLPRFEV